MITIPAAPQRDSESLKRFGRERLNTHVSIDELKSLDHSDIAQLLLPAERVKTFQSNEKILVIAEGQNMVPAQLKDRSDCAGRIREG